MSLGENIYKNRSLRGWSQSDLSDELGVSRQSVSKWENDTSTPDLDKLIKMSEIFETTLDDLVFGKKPEEKAEKEEKEEKEQISDPISNSYLHIKGKTQYRMLIGVISLIFGMTMFLLSMFFGNYLYFGEVFGELLSAVIALVSIAIMLPYNFKAVSICTIIYFVYSIVCFGIIKVNSTVNSIFSIVASVIIVVWFIICGEHAVRHKDAEDKNVKQS